MDASPREGGGERKETIALIALTDSKEGMRADYRISEKVSDVGRQGIAEKLREIAKVIAPPGSG